MPTNNVVLSKNETGLRLVKRKCREAHLDSSMLEELIAVAIKQQGKVSKYSITAAFERFLTA